MTEMELIEGLAVYRRDPIGAAPEALLAGLPGRPGLPVVFVHGAMDRGASFVKSVRLLPELEVIRYDRRGYGRSASAGVADTVDSHVRDLVGVTAGRPAIVVGHSFGAVLAMIAGARFPDLFVAVAAYEPPAPWESWWSEGSAGAAAVLAAEEEGPGAAAERFMRRVVGDRLWDSLPATTQDARRAEGSALVAELAALRGLPAIPFDPAALHARLVLGCGELTDDRHRRAVETLAGATAAGVEVIAGAGHGAHASHPTEFALLVRSAVALASTHV